VMRPSDVKAFRWLLPEEAARWPITNIKWWHGKTLKALPNDATMRKAIGEDGWHLQLELNNGQRLMLKPPQRAGQRRIFSPPARGIYFD